MADNPLLRVAIRPRLGRHQFNGHAVVCLMQKPKSLVVKTVPPKGIRADFDQLPFANYVAWNGRKPRIASRVDSVRTGPRLKRAVNTFYDKQWPPNPPIRLHALDQLLQRRMAIDWMQWSDFVR